MIVTCGGCARRYTFDAAKLAGRTQATVRCPNCQTPITVSAADPGDQTTRLETDANLLPKIGKIPGGDLALPADRRVSLAVLEGQDRGTIFPVDKPRVVLGRGDADIVINDSEVSRQHASLEVHGGRVVLRDLGSTNGTFVEDVKITQAELENRGEFRIGGTRLMLIFADPASEAEGRE
ncbi:MAG: FHA domain-containing protein [Candidatus Polarisedimenticolia bacterium]